jgi:hypothetical protein
VLDPTLIGWEIRFTHEIIAAVEAIRKLMNARDVPERTTEISKLYEEA